MMASQMRTFCRKSSRSVFAVQSSQSIQERLVCSYVSFQFQSGFQSFLDNSLRQLIRSNQSYAESVVKRSSSPSSGCYAFPCQVFHRLEVLSEHHQNQLRTRKQQRAAFLCRVLCPRLFLEIQGSGF